MPTDKEHATAVAEGDPAPDVTLRLHDGSELSLSSLEGSLVFLYFYPKDDTPGCTVEAQGLRDEHDALTELGVKVYGISTQDAESHKSFIDKHDLPFPLVIDDDGKVAKAFNVPVKGGFAARHSFLIGKDGKLLRIWRTVQPAQHAKEVLVAARNASS
jgi:peroxiredoxin Q/BCP